MQILFTVLDKGRYDYELHRGWYCSYFTESRTDYIPYYSYGIIPLLCKKIDGDRWVLKTNINLKQGIHDSKDFSLNVIYFLPAKKIKELHLHLHSLNLNTYYLAHFILSIACSSSTS